MSTRKSSTCIVALSFAIIFVVLEVFAASILRVLNNNYKLERVLLGDIAFEPCVLVFIESTTISYKGGNVCSMPTDEVKTVTVRKSVYANRDEVDLLARVAWCESGYEPFEGICLVIDTPLNRVDDPRFPNNIVDVLYAPGQYSTVHTKKFKECTPSKECYDAVYHELESRTNREVLYFGRSPITQKGVFKVGHHYFSS